MTEQTTPPDLVVLSLGAGVQSTTLALLAAEGVLPQPDVAVFADTGWEPRGVYEHLDRLEAALPYPVVRVQQGALRDEALDPAYGNRLPVYVQGRDGRLGPAMRQCTPHYKVRPIQDEIRRRLGATVSDLSCKSCDGRGTRQPPWQLRLATGGQDVQPTTCSVCRGRGSVQRVGPVPGGRWVEQWVGFSTDEVGRVSDSRVRYVRNRFPLLELGMSRTDCDRWLRSRGWHTVAKSACIGCPFHGNRAWRDLRDSDPEGWADAVAFDRDLRAVQGAVPLDGEAFLHASGLPLDQAPIDRVTRHEWREAQVDLFDAVADQLLEDGDPDGCSPYGCRSGQPVVLEDDADDLAAS